MHSIFSTADVPQAEAFDYWMDVACANVIRHDSRPVDRNTFSAKLAVGALADLSLFGWTLAPVLTHSGGGSDDLLLLQPSSRIDVEFADRTMEINRSNLYLIDHTQPFACRTRELVEQTALRIPRDALARRIRITRDVVNSPVPLQGDAALLSAFVRGLVRIGPSTLSPTAAAVVREQMIDLTAVVLGDCTSTMPRLGAAARFGTLKLRVFIESQLTNPDADAQSIAAGAGVSERHANRLLALEGTSIRRLLIERRLNKCHETIENPQHMHRIISDIAFFYGFRNLGHFTRVFKGRFGLSPSEHRSAFHSVRH